MRNHPEIFEHCLLSLYSKYLLYAEYYQTTGRLPLDSEDEITEENLREFSHTSNFHLLSQDSDETQFPLPLVVNTDGMIRGIGVEIQRIILQTVKPTHILHLQNEKDKILAPIEEMREQFEEKGDKKEEGNQNVKQKLHICILTPGRNTASRLSAQNLRDLRYALSTFSHHFLSLEWCHISCRRVPTLTRSLHHHLLLQSLLGVESAWILSVISPQH